MSETYVGCGQCALPNTQVRIARAKLNGMQYVGLCLRVHPELVLGDGACMVQERGAGIRSEPGIGGSQPLFRTMEHVRKVKAFYIIRLWIAGGDRDRAVGLPENLGVEIDIRACPAVYLVEQISCRVAR